MTIKIKPMEPTSNVVTAGISEAPQATGDNLPDSISHQQPDTSTEPPVALNEVAAALLKALQVPELVNWIINSGVSMPKSKRKEALIAAIVNSPGFAGVTKSTINEIIEKADENHINVARHVTTAHACTSVFPTCSLVAMLTLALVWSRFSGQAGQVFFFP
ncbi:hypothetical protein EI94DRAFT_1700772 [Lactarius quietus]|nr:hypothetical protein EI94DRAFT_1700772 [Lactarius quietus]